MVFSLVKEVYLSSWSSWPPSRASLSACSFPWIPQCAGIHCRLGLSGLQGRPGQFQLRLAHSGGDFGAEERESICEDDNIGLGSG